MQDREQVLGKDHGMIEVFPKVFVATIKEVLQSDKIQALIYLDNIMNHQLPNDAIWIPLQIQGKARRQQLTLFAMTIHTELANNNTVTILGHLDWTPLALAYYLHIMKRCTLREALEMVSQKIPSYNVDPVILTLIEDRVFA